MYRNVSLISILQLLIYISCQPCHIKLPIYRIFSVISSSKNLLFYIEHNKLRNHKFPSLFAVLVSGPLRWTTLCLWLELFMHAYCFDVGLITFLFHTERKTKLRPQEYIYVAL
jgi:hypothetical protein